MDVGRSLIVDQDVDVGSLHIKGTAIVERRDIAIGAEWILVEGAGALIAGSAEQPFKQTPPYHPVFERVGRKRISPSAVGQQISGGP